MELTLSQQTVIFLWSFLLGAILAGIYTVIAVIRVLSPPGKYMLFFSDLLFMLAGGFVNFIFALSCTNGMIRGYSLFFFFFVFCALYFTLGRLIRRSSFMIYDLLRRGIKKVFSPVCRLIHSIFLRTGAKCKILLKKFKKNKISLEK